MLGPGVLHNFQKFDLVFANSGGSTIARLQKGKSLRFDLADLRLLLNVVEAGSITAGAQRSHLALAAASARIRGMEDSLGMPLLIRGRRGVTPTSSGRAVLYHARLMLRQVERMNEELADYSGGAKGRIRLICSTAAMTEFLPNDMVGFLRDHPGIDVDIEERLVSDIAYALGTGSADIGIVSGTSDLSGLECVPFRQDRLVAIAPRGHALGARRQVDFADLLEHDFVGMSERSSLPLMLARHAAQLGKTLRYRVRVHSFEAICQLVHGGLGLGIVPEAVAMRYRHPRTIRRMRLRDPWAHRTWLICVRRHADLPTYAQDFIEALKAGAPPMRNAS